ncbi:hypothetical protein F4820DRAFT_468046 [Hypoxylon rubiginosum]|uniref:Uncharacterized protein n=1 Tax=Hypoxylon rubiginosum TaxID=110542 RepID=A0ACB9Z6S1_9PEZI|nr:hypothetical protein F4820DRAFT_468046 [Hypoxylon rubiginosum]
MVREKQDTQRPGTPRLRPCSNTSRNSHAASESGTGSKGVFSKVIGSLRNKHHGEKRKTDGSEKQQQQDESWTANYKITHHPDRPRIDKRSAKERTEREYANEIHRMQKRSQLHYELDHDGSRSMDRSMDRSTDRSMTPPRPLPPPQQTVQTSTPNYSPMSRMGSQPSSPYSPPTASDKPQWSPSGDRGPMQRHNRVPSEPLSPGTMTIQVYRGSLVDRQASRPCSAEPEHGQGPLLPRKVYDPNESYAKQALRDSGYARKASSSSNSTADSQAANNTVHRKAPSANLHSTAAAFSIPRTSSPISYNSPATPPQRAVRSLENTHSTTSTRIYSPSRPSTSSPYNSSSSKGKKPAPAPPKTKTCVMPGCAAPLLTDLDREQNVCAPCRKEYRQSTFDAAAATTTDAAPPPAPLAADLATLRALVGGLDNVDGGGSSGNNTRVTALERGPPARLVNKATSNFRADPFKLQPAPPGKRRRRQRLSKLGSGSNGAVARLQKQQQQQQQPVSAWSTSTSGISQGGGGGSGSLASGSHQQQHVAYQDRRLLFRASRKMSDARQPTAPTGGGGSREEAAAQYDSYLTESPRSSCDGNSGSWTSESPPKSEAGSDVASLSPLSEPLDDLDADTRASLRVAPLAPVAYVPPGEAKRGSGSDSRDRPPTGLRAAPRQDDGRPFRVAPLAPVARSASGTSDGGRVLPPVLPSRPSWRPSRPSRDTVMYLAIDDIIDSYARGEAGEEPEVVEMRRRGFF